MSIPKCFEKLKKYVSDSGLDERVPESRLREFARQLEVAGADALTPAEFASKAQNLIDNEMERWYAKKHAETVMVLAKREQALSSILENTQTFKQQIAEGKSGVLFKTDKPEQMATEAMRSWLEGGSLRPGFESNLSVEKMGKAIQGNLRDFFNEAVKGVKEAAASGAIDRDTFQELDALDRKLPLMQSGNQAALEYAKAIKGTRDKIFSLKQAYNPWLEEAGDYLVKNFHERARVTADPSEAGKKAWLDQAMTSFGDKSFPDNTLEEKLEIFKDIYDRISDGRWGSVRDDSASDKFITIYGDGGNLLRRMSKGRQLIPRDWQAFADYSSKYGPATIYEGLDRVMSSASRDIGMLSKFGPNPAGMYQGLYQRMLSRMEEPGTKSKPNPFYDPDGAQSLRENKKSLDEKFNVVTGSQNGPARGIIGKMTQGMMTLQYLSKTGGAVLRSLPDIALASNLVRDLNGESLFSNAAGLAKEYAKAMGSAPYAQERLNDVSLFSSAANAELMRTLGSPDAQPGKVAALAQKMGSLNLLNRHVDAMRSAMGTVLSKLLGDVSDTAHTDLPSQWQKGLARYGIGEPEWNMIRQGQQEMNGKTMITPEAVENLPHDQVADYLKATGQFAGVDMPSPKLLDYGRAQLALKLGTMINEHADLGSAHPDTRQRSFLWGDTDISQGWGMLRRLMTQFKMATLVSNDIYRRGYLSGQSPKGDYYGVVQHMILGGFIFTVGEYAKQLAMGKTPEDPTQPMFAAKMLAGSGMAGMYGDVFLNEMERQGVSDKMLAGATALLGPTLGTANEMLALGLQGASDIANRGSLQDATKRRGIGLFIGNIPAQNLFYTKAAFNYYFANGLREFMGPGYLSYLERKTAQTPGLGGGSQQYLFGRPTSPSFVEGR